MAKTSSVFRNLKRVKMAQKFNNRRSKLKEIVMDKMRLPKSVSRQLLNWRNYLVTRLKTGLETVAKLPVVHAVITGNSV